jgi:hypothetical protein
MENNKAAGNTVDQYFWGSKMAALRVALRNGWEFQWPADAPEDWTKKALKEAANYPGRYLKMAGQAAAAR